MPTMKAVLIRTAVLLPYGYWELKIGFKASGHWFTIITTTN